MTVKILFLICACWVLIVTILKISLIREDVKEIKRILKGEEEYDKPKHFTLK